MREIYTSTPAMLLLVIGSYFIGTLIYRRMKTSWFHPVVVGLVLVIAVLSLLHIDYETFHRGSAFIDFLLGPSVVALGYLLYEQMEHLKGHETAVFLATLIGGCIGVTSVILLGWWFGMDEQIISSLQPKSVTIPIAISLSKHSGGIPALTTVVVFFCGVLGSIIGPWLLNKCRIKNPIARGLALGSASHGLGTARAIELGAIEGAISGLAIGLTGIVTSVLIPFFEWLLR